MEENMELILYGSSADQHKISMLVTKIRGTNEFIKLIKQFDPYGYRGTERSSTGGCEIETPIEKCKSQ